MKRYFVVRGGDQGTEQGEILFNEFLQRVEEMLERGWVCQGGVSVINIGAGTVLLAQAMVKEE